MKNLEKTLVFLAFFPVLDLALAQGLSQEISKENLNKSIKVQEQIQHQNQQQKWFSKGDMYEWRNKKAPLKIIICQDNLFPEHLLADYDSMPIVRDDSVFEAKNFKDGHEWFPPYMVDKNYMKRLTDNYLKGWFEQTNYWLGYLSGNKFQLELEGIERIVTDYWNGSFNFNCGSAFTMIIHPNAGSTGFYSGEGIFWINPLFLTYDKNDKNKYSIVPIHEILHSFFGPDHSPDTMSTMDASSSYIGLPKDEADFLGWPEVKPKKLKQIKL